MAKESFQNSDLFKDTKMMLKGITSPINVDPTEIDKLGAKIIRETMS
jgi:hypothetical protein